MSSANCTDLLEDPSSSYSNELYLLVSVATVTLSFVLNLSQLLLICQHGLYRTRMHLIIANLCAVGLLASAAVLWHIRRILIGRDDPAHSSGGWHEYRLCMLLPSGLHLLSIFTFSPLITLLVLQHHHVAKRFNLMKQSLAVVYLLVMLSWCQAAVISLVPFTGWNRWEGVCAIPLTWSSSFAVLVCVLYFLHYPIVVIVLADLCLHSSPNSVSPEEVVHELSTACPSKNHLTYMPVPSVTSENESCERAFPNRHSHRVHPIQSSSLPLVTRSAIEISERNPSLNRPFSDDHSTRTSNRPERNSVAKNRPFSDPSLRSHPIRNGIESDHIQSSATALKSNGPPANSIVLLSSVAGCNGFTPTSQSPGRDGSIQSAIRSNGRSFCAIPKDSTMSSSDYHCKARTRRCNLWFWYTQKRGMCAMMFLYAICTLPFILYTATSAIYSNQDLCGALVANEKATMWTTWLLVVFAALRPLFHIVDEDDELSEVTFSFIASVCCNPKFRNY